MNSLACQQHDCHSWLSKVEAVYIYIHQILEGCAGWGGEGGGTALDNVAQSYGHGASRTSLCAVQQNP